MALLLVAEKRVRVHQIFAIPDVLIPNNVHWGDVVNHSLASAKVRLLSKISNQPFKNITTIKSCGLFLRINSDFALPQNIMSLSTNTERVDLEFYWFDCQSLGMNSSQFDDEVGQDCVNFTHNDWEISIQRDFVSARISHHVYLISFSQIADGLQNSLRCIIPRLLLKRHHFVLHCSAVAINENEAIAFMGPSGVGKSTIVSKVRGLIKLHDDMNIVSFGLDQSIQIKGAELGSILVPDHPNISKQFTLVAVYQLFQSDKNEVIQVSPAQSFTYLLSNFANYFWESLPQGDVLLLSEAAQRISNSIPITELHNNAGEEVWQILKGIHGLS